MDKTDFKSKVFIPWSDYQFLGDMDSGGFQVVDDDTLKPFVCEKEPVFETWNKWMATRYMYHHTITKMDNSQ